jgi:hemerythrin-like domain-containing protein
MTQQQVLPADEAEMVHEEHVELRTNLSELDDALNRLRFDSETRGELMGASEIGTMVRRFQAFLPLHFQHEEESLLDNVSAVSPELMELTEQLRREHQYLAYLFSEVAETARNFYGSEGVESQVARVKFLGAAFTDQFRRHMSVEETELAGFL